MEGQADPGLRITSAGFGGRTGDGEDGRRNDHCCRIVPTAESRLQGTLLPDYLCGHLGRDLWQIAQIQTSPEGPPSREGKGGRSQGTAAHDLTMQS